MGNQHYFGVSTLDDCRRLCNLAVGCNFFVFKSESNEDKCTLKYGVGQKKLVSLDSNYVFGSWNCGEQRHSTVMQRGEKNGGVLSSALPISAAGIGVLLLIALISAFLCLR